MIRDLTCIAENMVYPADPEKTGINLNEIIVGATGCGKSMSIAYPRLANTFDSSIVVPITKRAIMDKFARTFKKRGYRVEVIDFAEPENSTIGYDPLDFMKSEEDALQIAKTIVESDVKVHTNADPFWNQSAESVIAGLILLLKENEKYGGKKATFADVTEMFRNIIIGGSGSKIKTNLDVFFSELEKRESGSQAAFMWQTFVSAPEKTGNTIYCCANNAMDKYMSRNIKNLVTNENRICFRELGKGKTILFIRTSPVNKVMNCFVNMMYSDMFRDMFEYAESNSNGRMDVPVHVICDDFACGTRILDFENYISIFRAAGISVSILVQSESQLNDIYGECGGKTILNNCDTYIYMGGMDYETCRSISLKTNKPIEKIVGLPKEQIIVFRRGEMPVMAKRYQTLSDPEYIKVMSDME